jgi:hypothetical protein
MGFWAVFIELWPVRAGMFEWCLFDQNVWLPTILQIAISHALSCTDSHGLFFFAECQPHTHLIDILFHYPLLHRLPYRPSTYQESFQYPKSTGMAHIPGDVLKIWCVNPIDQLSSCCNVCTDSDIISLNLVQDTIIVLNSLSAVDTLLEDKSILYSDQYGISCSHVSTLPTGIPTDHRFWCSMICKI